jgi:GT2 family glycosyltransferase
MQPTTQRQGTQESSASRPEASIVVVGWRSAPHLLECLQSLSMHYPSTTHEVIVFLNEPVSGLAEHIRARWEHVAVMTSSVNLGFGGAVNRAARQASGTFLVLLNDDATVERGWLEALVSAWNVDPAAGAVGSKVLTPAGAASEEGAVLWSDGSITIIDPYHRPVPAPGPGVRRVDYCSAVSLLVPRASWDAVGGLDEGYFPAYCEDVDLCLKLRALGRVVLYQPDSVVRHHHGSSTSPRFRRFLQERNTHRLRQRWPHALSRCLDPAPHRPHAIGNAVALAARLEPEASDGPRIADQSMGDRADPLVYLQMQLAVTEEYAAVLERKTDSTAGSRLVALAKAALRHSPRFYRLVARVSGGSDRV